MSKWPFWSPAAFILSFKWIHFWGVIMVWNGVWLHTSSKSDTDMIVMTMVFKWITAHCHPAGMSTKELDWLYTKASSGQQKILESKFVEIKCILCWEKKSLSTWSTIELSHDLLAWVKQSWSLIKSLGWLIWLATDKVSLCGHLHAFL